MTDTDDTDKSTTAYCDRLLPKLTGDGRIDRWREHRARARARAELVEACITAIDELGPEPSIDITQLLSSIVSARRPFVPSATRPEAGHHSRRLTPIPHRLRTRFHFRRPVPMHRLQVRSPRQLPHPQYRLHRRPQIL